MLLYRIFSSWAYAVALVSAWCVYGEPSPSGLYDGDCLHANMVIHIFGDQL